MSDQFQFKFDGSRRSTSHRRADPKPRRPREPARDDRILPGDPRYKTDEELARWYAEPRDYLNGNKSWNEVYVPLTNQGRQRFAARMEAIDDMKDEAGY